MTRSRSGSTQFLGNWRPSVRTGGFSLIELVVVVSVIAILAALTVPSLRPLLQGAALRAAATQVLAATRQARLTAVTHQVPVLLTMQEDKLVQDPGLDGTSPMIRTLPDGIHLTMTHGVRFLPDGTTEDRRWRLTDARGASLEVQIAGVTGHAQVTIP